MGTASNPQLSCVVKSLATVLKTVLGLEQISCHAAWPIDATIRVLSYRDDFEFLWGLSSVVEENGLPRFFDDNEKDGVVIVVWDAELTRVGSTISDLSKYLTPLDWVIWYSLTMVDGSPAKPLPRLFVVDLASERAVGADSVRFFDLFPNRSPSSMPWMRLFRVSPNSNNFGFTDLISCLHSNAVHVDKRTNAEVLRRIWRGSFLKPTEPSDNHAIANVIGPSLLLEDVRNEPQRRALATFLQRLQLLPQSSTPKQVLGSGTTWINWCDKPWKKLIDRIKSIDNRQLNILLVDDAAIHNRWGEVVARALGLRYAGPSGTAETPHLIADGEFDGVAAELFATESAQGFLQSLRAIDVGRATMPMPFHFGCNVIDASGEPSHETIDVILLDLRLFQGRTLATEARFLRQVVSLAKSFCNDAHDRNDQLRWPGFRANELETIEKWLDRVEQGDPQVNREQSDYLQALTLLPRLVSLLDFSLPIIFFSSTDRRQIVDALTPHRNIITSFDKPRLQLGQDIRIAEDLAHKFRAAFAAALEMVVARRLCAALLAKPQRVSWEDYRAKLPSHVNDGCWRVHLMLDETEPQQSQLKVGGLMAVYPPGEDPYSFSDMLISQFPNVKADKNYTRKNAEAITRAVLDASSQRHILVVPISLTGDLSQTVYSDIDQSDELHDERVGDNLHRELVRCVTELGIYCVARQILPDDADVEFSVMAATRIGELPDDKMERALQERWGVKTEYVGLGRWWGTKEELARLVQRQSTNPVFHKAAIDAATAFCSAVDLADALPASSGGMVANTRERLRKRMVLYFNRSDARPLVEEVMREYRHSGFEPLADIARAYSLNAFATSEAERIHALHFLTDALIGTQHNGASIQEVNRLAISGRYGERLVTLLESHRLVVKALLPEALVHGGFAAVRDRGNDPASNSITFELQRAARELTGPEFMTLCKLLGDSESPTRAATARQGRVTRLFDNGLLVNDGRRTYYSAGNYCTDFGSIRVGDYVSFVGRRGNCPGSWLARKVERTNP